MNPFKAILLTTGALLLFILMGTLIPVMMGTPWGESIMQLLQMTGCCVLVILGGIALFIQMNRFIG
jgi:hypothetical protein